MKKWRQNPALILISVGVLSLGLISVTDKLLFNFLKNLDSSLSLLADLRLSSLLLVSFLYIGILKTHIVEPSVKILPTKKDFRGPIIWLVLTAYFVLIKKVWVPNLKDWVDWTAFMITGLVAEEILFRGILYDLCVKVFQDRRILNLSMPVLITSILFGLQHLSYHGFKINSASITSGIYDSHGDSIRKC
jgi:membrane protease YdiL (CAAX protease family)